MPPFYYDPNLNPDEDKQQTQISSAVPIAGPTGSTGTTQTAQQPKTGSGFENLEKYLNVNQPQAFGAQAYGKLENQIQGAGAQMNTAADQFRSQVQNANVLPTSQQITSAIADPSKANATQFQGWENQTYKGPQSLNDSSAQNAWNQYWSGANQAQANAALLGKDSGRSVLLDEYFGRPGYTSGQKTLDSQLLQRAGLGGQAQQLQNEATALQGRGAQTAQNLQGYAAQRAGDVEQSRNAVLNAIGLDTQGNVIRGGAQGQGALGNLQDQIQNEFSTKQALVNQQNAQYLRDLSQNRLTPDELSSLRLSSGRSLYGVDPSKYFTPAEGLTNVSQTATPEERARLEALSQLAGTPQTFLQAAQTPKALGYDVAGLEAGVTKAAADYKNAPQSTYINVPPQYTADGSGKMTVAEAEREIAIAQQGIAKGQVLNAQPFIDLAAPLVAKAHKDIDAQYQINRTLNQPMSTGKLPQTRRAA